VLLSKLKRPCKHCSADLSPGKAASKKRQKRTFYEKRINPCVGLDWPFIALTSTEPESRPPLENIIVDRPSSYQSSHCSVFMLPGTSGA